VGAFDSLLVMKKPVLIVIDMLNDFLSGWDRTRRENLVQAINGLAGAMRRLSLPVVWIRQEFEPDLRDAFPEMRAKRIHKVIKGTAGCQILPELALAPSDRVIVKKRYSAFFGTNLDRTLSQIVPDAIILAGINTHACIRTTAIDAYQRDWTVVLALDCIDSYDREHHDVSLRYMKDKIAAVMSNQEIGSALLATESTEADPPV
jgi:nicotinamidase-related amidase